MHSHGTELSCFEIAGFKGNSCLLNDLFSGQRRGQRSYQLKKSQWNSEMSTEFALKKAVNIQADQHTCISIVMPPGALNSKHASSGTLWIPWTCGGQTSVKTDMWNTFGDLTFCGLDNDGVWASLSKVVSDLGEWEMTGAYDNGGKPICRHQLVLITTGVCHALKSPLFSDGQLQQTRSYLGLIIKEMGSPIFVAISRIPDSLAVFCSQWWTLVRLRSWTSPRWQKPLVKSPPVFCE